MKQKLARMFIACIGVAVAATATAMDVITYEKHRAEASGSPNRNLQRIYLLAVGEGFKWANASLGSQKQPLLFCAPEQLPLTPENYAQLIDSALSSNRDKYIANELPVEAILLFQLQSKLPCGAK